MNVNVSAEWKPTDSIFGVSDFFLEQREFENGCKWEKEIEEEIEFIYSRLENACSNVMPEFMENDQQRKT